MVWQLSESMIVIEWRRKVFDAKYRENYNVKNRENYNIKKVLTNLLSSDIIHKNLINGFDEDGFKLEL